MNKIFLTGNLTRDPELKQGGTSVYCRFSIAVNRRFSKEKDAVDFFNCVSFGKTAEVINRYFAKGRRIFIEGHLQINSYTDKDGNKRNSTEVIVEQMEFAGDKKSSVDDKKDFDNIEGTPINEEDTPF